MSERWVATRLSPGGRVYLGMFWYAPCHEWFWTTWGWTDDALVFPSREEAKAAVAQRGGDFVWQVRKTRRKP